MAYHYKESGLDNIYLVNGYTIHETPYGEGVSIENVEELHKTIGRWLISLPKKLDGAEFRFLRLEMEMTQRHLAALLGEEEQSVRRWEKARKKSVKGSADRMMRVLYKEYVNGDGSIRAMIDRLAELDNIDRAEARLCTADHHTWRVECNQLAA